MRAIASLVVALALADSAMAGSDPNLLVGVRPRVAEVGSSVDPAVGDALRDRVSLDVPYLHQTEALCGGAAVAMLFRYWGDRHADVQQFATLVDRRAGGIATDILTQAVKNRGWDADIVDGSVDVIRRELAVGHPLILLIQDRPGRYHYVAAVAADAERVWLHDPTWGPSRPYAIDELTQIWRPASFWALRIVPQNWASSEVPSEARGIGIGFQPDAATVHSGVVPQAAGPPAAVIECDRALADGVAEIERRGLDIADSVLSDVRARCPDASGPISELAGIRFAQRRFGEAESLSQQAASRNAEDTYAWDVLGSSRFVRDNLDGALQAWNHAGKPRLDSIRIQGLTRTRYALVAQMLRLSPNALLDAESYRLAERRLDQLPDRLDSRIGYRPDPDGFAVVDVAISERPRRPGNAVAWSLTGARALVNREVAATVPGWSGQGEVWSASWRWWEERPRVTLAFAAPRAGRWPGVWRVDGSWDAQTYAISSADAPLRETQKQVNVGVSDWLTPQLRYALTAGAHSWDGGEQQQKTLSLGGTLERRLFDDRIALSASFRHWMSLSAASGFREGSLHAAIHSSTTTRGFVHLAEAHVEAASENAPMSLWPGSGDGQGRPRLLRAHPLLKDGVIGGPAFGRRLLSITFESQRWFERPAIARAGVAVFADVGRAWQRLNAGGKPLQVDAGIGLRLRAPGHDGTLRIDYARGLRDGRGAISVGISLLDSM